MKNSVETVEKLPDSSDNQDYLRDLGYWDVSIEVNDQCNFHCTYCPYDSDPTHEQVVMDLGRAKNFINHLANGRAVDGEVSFNLMGEPLMYSGLFELIKYTNIKGLKTKVVTNGALLTAKNIDGLIDASPALLKISVESLDPAAFANLRGTTIKFETYLSRISNMVSRAISAGDEFKSYLQLDLMYDHRLLFNLKRLCGLEGPDEGRNGVYTDKRRLFNDIQLFVQKLVDEGNLSEAFIKDLMFERPALDDNAQPLLMLAPNIAFHSKTYHRWADIFSKKYPVANDGRGCEAGNIGIHASGDVSLCCLDFNASTKIGNVFDQTLPEILTTPTNTKIIQDLRKGIYHFDACKSCQGHSAFLGKLGYGTVRQKTVRRTLKSFKKVIKTVARR